LYALYQMVGLQVTLGDHNHPKSPYFIHFVLLFVSA